jgi:hypothetical protein
MKEAISSTRSIRSSFSRAPGGRTQPFSRMIERRVEVGRVEMSVPWLTIVRKSEEVEGGDLGWDGGRNCWEVDGGEGYLEDD